MAKVEYLSYDENVDHLTLYKADERIVSNKDIGVAILSLNRKKEVVGIELMGAHKNFGVPLDVLKHLKDCKVEIRYNPVRKFLVANVSLKYLKKKRILNVGSALALGKIPFNDVFACTAA